MKLQLPIKLLLLAALIFLPACGAGYPVTGSVSFREPRSGAKAGLVFAPGVPVRGSVRLPVYDPATGAAVGQVDLHSGK